MKNRLILWFLIFVFGLAVGFVPQYSDLRQRDRDLLETNRALTSCQLDSRLSELRDLGAMAYLEASRRNYGLAGTYTSRFFNLNRELVSQVTEPRLKQSLEALLEMRDQITAGLATTDPNVLAELQTLLTKTHESTKH